MPAGPSSETNSDLSIRVAGQVRTMLGQDMEGTRLVVAVSGGLDSTVLLHVLSVHFPARQIQAIHFNYHLRGEESDQDQAFVETFCKKAGIACEVVHCYLKEEGDQTNIQDWARKARYDHLMNGPQPEPCAVLTAHHAQDQAETILYRIFKGYPPDLCVGMAPISTWKSGRRLIRPMLEIWPEDVLAYALGTGLSWREDSSNQTDAYSRNRIRRHILPALEHSLGPEWRTGLLGFAEGLRSTLGSNKEAIKADAFGNPAIALSALLQSPRPGQLLSKLTGRYVSPGQADEILRTLDAGRRKAFRTRTGRYLLDRDQDVIFLAEEKEKQPIPVLDLPCQISLFGGQTLRIEQTLAPHGLDFKEEGQNGRFYIDISMPFLVRSWNPADRIALLGRTGETKVRDLIEKQPSILARETAWVLEKDGEIAFVSTGRVARWAAVQPGQPCIRLRIH